MGEKEKIWVRDILFYSICDGYMRNDIKSMLTIPHASAGSCASPLCAYIFTCMEWLGYLVADDELSLDRSSFEYIEAYAKLVFEDADKDCFMSNRAGIALICERLPYSLLGFGGFGTTRDSKWPTFSYLDEWIVNANKLAWMFLRSLGVLVSLIRDDAMATRIYERYWKLTAEFKNAIELR